jgi:hypothetical protein
MPAEGPVIPFFTDQNVPDSVGAALVAAGHTVTRLRDAMDTTTVDPVVAAACVNSGHVLVTHDGDFKRNARAMNVTQRAYKESLDRIVMECPEPRSAQRLMEVLPFIELAWTRKDKGKPLSVVVTDVAIRIYQCWEHPPRPEDPETD